jgi:hypothetical protein
MTTTEMQKRFNKLIQSFDGSIAVLSNMVEAKVRLSHSKNGFVFFRYRPTIKYQKFSFDTCFNKRNVIFLIGHHSTKNDIIKVRLNKELDLSQKVSGSGRDFCYFSVCNMIPVNLIEKNLEISIKNKNHGDFTCIMCMCSIEISSYLRENAFACDVITDKVMSHMVYSNNDVNLSETKDTEMLNIPCISSSEDYREYLAKKTSDAIYFDLLEVTMRPDNLTNILSIDDKIKYKIE